MRTCPLNIKFLIGLAGLLCSLQPLAAAESQRWALLIGVNEYVELKSLSYAGPDMRALGEQLKASGFADSRRTLLHDEAKDVRFRPSRANIERELELLLKRVQKDDLLLVAFSGHGLYLDGKSYFCPTEAKDDDRERTLIAEDWLYEKLNGCPAALKILLLDACRNDPRPAGKRSSTPKEDLDKLWSTFERPPEGLVVLRSCGLGQVSWEDEKLGHGVFMNFVLKGLSGAADGNKNGKVSLEELFEFSCDKTEEFVATNRRDFQRPSRKGEINGKFEFLPSGPKPSEVLTNSIGMKLVQIPAGEFEMGDNSNDDEKPRHRVRISQSFHLGRYEVTLGDFLRFYHDSGHKMDLETGASGYKGGFGFVPKKNGSFPFEIKVEFVPWNTGFPQTYDHPVVNVSWNDAQSFCTWLSRKEGKIYRLPTEAEWEYACRAGTTTKYSTGDNNEGLGAVANIMDASLKRKSAYYSSEVERDDGFPFTAPVGSFKPNAWGLYDMHGNVGEWCADRYEKEYYGTFNDTVAVDPQGSIAGSLRVLRGSDWTDGESICRSARRGSLAPARRDCEIGFRVVLSSR